MRHRKELPKQSRDSAGAEELGTSQEHGAGLAACCCAVPGARLPVGLATVTASHLGAEVLSNAENLWVFLMQNELFPHSLFSS